VFVPAILRVDLTSFKLREFEASVYRPGSSENLPCSATSLPSRSFACLAENGDLHTWKRSREHL